MENKKINFFFLILFFILGLFSLHAMNESDSKSSDAVRKARMKALRATWDKEEQKRAKSDFDALATSLSKLTISDKPDFDEPLQRPSSLLFSWLARELHTKRNNPGKLYKLLSLKKLCKYPLALIVGYMRILNINPDQKIIEAAYNGDGGFYRHVPLLLQAAADNNIQVYRILWYSGADAHCSDNTGRTLANFPDIKAQFLKSVLIKETAQQALVDYYLNRYKTLRDYRRIMLQTFVAEIFLLQSTNPKFFRHITPELVKNRIIRGGVIRDHTVDLYYDEKTLEPFNRDVLFNTTHTLSLTSEFLRGNLVLKAWIYQATTMLSKHTPKDTDIKDTEIKFVQSPVVQTAARECKIVSTGVTPHIENVFEYLEQTLFTLRNNPDELYAFLSGSVCKTYPILLVISYIKILNIDPNQNMSSGKSLLYQAVFDKDTNTYAILTAVGATVDMALLPKEHMSVVAEQYVNNRRYQVTTPEAQYALLNFYLDYAKMHTSKDSDILKESIRQITILKGFLPGYFKHVTDEKIQEMIRTTFTVI